MAKRKITKALDDPTKVSSGASPFVEVGITGVTRYGGISRVYEEFFKELQGPTGMKLYREQIDNCPVTGAFLFAAQHLARGATFRFTPASGPNVDPQIALNVAERLKGAVFDDMEQTWPDQLSEILTMMGFGWSNFEMVFKVCRGQSASDMRVPQPNAGSRGQGPAVDLPDGSPAQFVPSKFNDGMVGFKKWSIRAQETLFMWEWDDESNPIVMQQMAPPDFKIRRIPLSKSLLFRTEMKKNNPEGRSLLRNSVISYLYRKGIQQIESIGIERDLAGYPTFQVISPKEAEGYAVPDIWNPNDANAIAFLAQLKQTARSIKRDEQEGLVLPWWVKFNLVSTGSRRQFDTNAIITRYDQRIAMSVLADFVMIGHQAVGSKALASTKSSLFAAALTSFLTNICAVVNRFATPLWLELNGIPPQYAPTLDHGDVESVDLADLGDFISKLAGAGMPLFPSPDLEAALLQAAKLPDTGVAEEEQAEQELGTAPGAEDLEPMPGQPQPKANPNATKPSGWGNQ